MIKVQVYDEKLTVIGNCSLPGITGTPVIKSFVTKGRKTTER